MQASITLPIATVQPDFESVISDVREGRIPEDSFWLSSYKTGEQSVHGRVQVTLDEVDRDLVVLTGINGVEFRSKGDVCVLYFPVAVNNKA